MELHGVVRNRIRTSGPAGYPMELMSRLDPEGRSA